MRKAHEESERTKEATAEKMKMMTEVRNCAHKWHTGMQSPCRCIFCTCAKPCIHSTPALTLHYLCHALNSALALCVMRA